MSRAYLGLGSNIGDKTANLKSAAALISADDKTRIVASSSMYSTAPVGYLDQDDFVNAVIEVETTLEPHALLELCQAAEKALRRIRKIRWGPRTLDVDVLLYDNLVSGDPVLTLPHPRMLERAFVLVPLAEIAPGLVVSGRRVDEWLKEIGSEGIHPLDVIFDDNEEEA
jgi:2-amino-4-hydroxy-6-hydroxymethyldihydropteridine diphosphokinase